MPQSNKRLPKIDHGGRPVTRSYRALGSSLATPLPHQPQPAPANRQRRAEGLYAAVVDGVREGYVYKRNSEAR